MSARPALQPRTDCPRDLRRVLEDRELRGGGGARRYRETDREIAEIVVHIPHDKLDRRQYQALSAPRRAAQMLLEVIPDRQLRICRGHLEPVVSRHVPDRLCRLDRELAE